MSEPEREQTPITFDVHGTPIAQGSKRYVGAGRMIESNTNLRPWRAAVAAEAARAMDEQELFVGPVWVTASFRFTRPRTHFRTGKFAGELKPGAPLWPASGQDLDKLERAVGDALTGVAFHDDRQIAVWEAQKIYDGRAGATITVRPLARQVEAALWAFERRARTIAG